MDFKILLDILKTYLQPVALLTNAQIRCLVLIYFMSNRWRGAEWPCHFKERVAFQPARAAYKSTLWSLGSKATISLSELASCG